jgi:5-formyltetrahydrofolate cyclo-ligase
MPVTKQQVRKEYIHKRNVLSQNEYEDLSGKLLVQFKQLDLHGIQYLHMFLPIHKRKEPDTFLISDWLKAHHPEISLAYPKTNFADHTMQSFVDDESLQIGINALGIPEPVTGTEVEPGKIELVLVPLLAFDKYGYRAGYGKGFYDRFMAQCKENTQFIGLSFFEPVDQIIDIDQYDKKLTKCVTPGKVYEFDF